MAQTADQIALGIINQARILDPAVSAEVGTPERLLIEATAELIAAQQVDFSVLEQQHDLSAMSGGRLDAYLDGVYSFGRQQATPAYGTVTFSRTTGSTNQIIIPRGTQVQANINNTIFSQLIFVTTETVVLEIDTTTVSATIQCTLAGTVGNIDANTIVGFGGFRTIPGVSGITNEQAFTGGEDAEDDFTYKQRFQNTFLRNISGTTDMYLALALSLNSVSKANVVSAVSRYLEYIQVPDDDDAGQRTASDGYDPAGLLYPHKRTSALSTIPYSKYTYLENYYLTDSTLNPSSAKFFRPGVDFVFNSPPVDASNAPFQGVTGPSVTPDVTFLNPYDVSANPDGDQFLSAGGVVLLEHAYMSLHSRNNVDFGIYNCVDIYVNGGQPLSVSSVEVVPGSGHNIQDTNALSWTYQQLNNAEVATAVLTSDNTNVSAADQVTIGSRTYTFVTDLTGAYATGTLKSNNTNPANNDTLILGDKTYTFKSTLSTGPTIPNEIKIGANANATLTNIKDAINDTGTPGTGYSVGTVVHDQVAGGTLDTGAHTLVVNALEIGTIGNLIASDETSANLLWIAVINLTGGAATAATATLTATSKPLEGETVQIGNRTYTWRKNLSNPEVADEIKIGDVGSSLKNLYRAINGLSRAGKNYSVGTDPHTQVSAATPKNNKLIVSALTIGKSGNSLTVSDTMSGMSWGGNRLSGGVAAAATGTLTSNNTNVSNGDVVVIGNKTYTFRTSISVANDILVGADADTSLTNLKAAINAESGSGTLYGTGTTASTQVTAGSVDTATHSMVITALTNGTGGNSIAVSTTAVTLSWGGDYLHNGIDPIASEILIDGSADASLTNLKKAINNEATAGTNYGLGTLVNADVSSSAVSSHAITITALVAGRAGNSIGTSTTAAHLSWADDTMVGGVSQTINWQRKIDAATSDIGNRVQPLYWQPVIELPDSLLVGTSTYYRANYFNEGDSTYYNLYDGTSYSRPAHYVLVEEVNNLYGTIRARNGIEWFLTGANYLAGQLVDDDPDVYGGVVIDDQVGIQFNVENYQYDKNVGDLQAIVERKKQTSTDPLVHRARRRYFRPIVTIMYSFGTTKAVVDASIIANLSNFLSNQYFGAAIQLSDILQVIHNTPGVDNVRWTDDDPDTGNKIEEVSQNGNSLDPNVFFIKDFFLQDNEMADLPTTDALEITVRAANTWSQ